MTRVGKLARCEASASMAAQEKSCFDRWYFSIYARPLIRHVRCSRKSSDENTGHDMSSMAQSASSSSSLMSKKIQHRRHRSRLRCRVRPHLAEAPAHELLRHLPAQSRPSSRKCGDHWGVDVRYTDSNELLAAIRTSTPCHINSPIPDHGWMSIAGAEGRQACGLHGADGHQRGGVPGNHRTRPRRPA